MNKTADPTGDDLPYSAPYLLSGLVLEDATCSARHARLSRCEPRNKAGAEHKDPRFNWRVTTQQCSQSAKAALWNCVK